MVPEQIAAALANPRRLRILGWLKDPEANFPRQVYGDLVEDAGGDRCFVRAGGVGFLFEPGIGSWRDVNCKRHGKLLRNSIS